MSRSTVFESGGGPCSLRSSPCAASAPCPVRSCEPAPSLPLQGRLPRAGCSVNTVGLLRSSATRTTPSGGGGGGLPRPRILTFPPIVHLPGARSAPIRLSRRPARADRDRIVHGGPGLLVGPSKPDVLGAMVPPSAGVDDEETAQAIGHPRVPTGCRRLVLRPSAVPARPALQRRPLGIEPSSPAGQSPRPSTSSPFPASPLVIVVGSAARAACPAPILRRASSSPASPDFPSADASFRKPRSSCFFRAMAAIARLPAARGSSGKPVPPSPSHRARRR